MIKAFGMPLHTRQTPHECQNRAFYGTSLHNCAARAAYTRLLHAAATEPFRTCKVPMDAAKKRPRRPPGSRQVASPAAMICATEHRQYATIDNCSRALVELLHPFFRAAAPRQRKRGSGAARLPRGSTTSSSTSWLAIALECVCRGAAPATMRSHNVGGADAWKDPACADRNQPLTARERDIHAEQEWPALEARLDARARALCALEQGVLAQQGRPHKFMTWQRGSVINPFAS